MGVASGVYDIGTIRDTYNEFAEGGDTGDNWTLEDEAGYNEWLEGLPDNLRYTNEREYNMREAYKTGMQPHLEDDGLYHFSTRNPFTGDYMKAPQHRTTLKGLMEDALIGYYPVRNPNGKYQGRINTDTWEGNKGNDKYPRLVEKRFASGGPLVKRAHKYYEGGDTQQEAINKIIEWSQTDPNTGERNPFYSREYDTYGTVELPEVDITEHWTPQGLRNTAAREGRQYMYDAMNQGYDVVGPLLTTLVSAPMDFYPMETLLSGFSKAGSAAQGNKILKQASMETPAKEWAEGIPKITRENMHTISDAGWDMAYFDAINSGDIAEAQRLRDLHFKAKGNTILLDDVGMPEHFYHGSPATDIVEFRHVPPRTGGRGTGTEGYYFTPKRSYAERYKAKDLMRDIDTSGGRIYDVYLNAEKVANFPKDYPSNVGVDAFYHMNAPERKILEDSGFDAAELGNVLNNRTGKRPEVVVLEPNQIKLSDVITRDNHGHIIPLSQRDNFNLKDIRYGWIPLVIGGSVVGTGYNALQQKSLGGPLVDSANEYRKGGKIHIKPENRGKFTALMKRTGHSASWFKKNGTPA